MTGALAAAAGPLVALAVLGLVGWFLSDAGVHGAPRDGMRVGALVWLAAHGGGFEVSGVLVSVVPLGLTGGVAWTVWRTAMRTGERLSGVGPDVHRLADGERDWTVPVATAWFAATYLVVAMGVAALTSAGAVGTSLVRVTIWVVALMLCVAAPALGVGSGRAAVLASRMPAPVLTAAAVARAVFVWFWVTCLVVFLGALLLDFDELATIFSTLHASPGEAFLFAAVALVYVPNAVGFTAAYLLGPGFQVGAGNVVTLAGTELGPMPLFPLVPALPGTGAAPSWLAALMAVGGVVAAVATLRVLLRSAPMRWDHTLLAGAGGALVGAVGVAGVVGLSGGAAGPGLMAEVGANMLDVMAHGVATFVVAGLVVSLAVVGWRHRTPRQGR